MKSTACKDCGIIITVQNLDNTSQYSCPRCHSVIYRSGESFGLVLSMSISALLFFVPAIFLPIMSLEILGQIKSVTLLEAVWFFVNDGYIIIAIIAAASGIVIPLLLLVLIVMLIFSLKAGYKPKEIIYFYRAYSHLSGWAMAEVYLVSIFVAIVKLSGMALLILDFGLLSFVFFIVTFYIAITWFNPNDIWNNNEI